MSRFPFAAVASHLVSEDLYRLAIPFAHSVRHFFPGTDVVFSRLDDIAGQLNDDPAWRDGLCGVRDRGRPALSPDAETLFLPLWNGDDLVGVAVLHNGDLPFRDMSGSWLLEVSRILSREFCLIKQWSLDGATGLPNGQQLRAGLAAELAHGSEDDSGGRGSLVLVEVHVKGQDGEQVLAQISRAAAALDGLVGGVSPLYACGAGVFGAIWNDIDSGQALKMGEALLRRLKRENYQKVHLGLTRIAGIESDVELAASQLLDQAWEALCVARRRGPHALCSHEALSRKQDHPFALPDAEVMNPLRKLWRGVDRFALLLFRADGNKGDDAFAGRLAALLGPGTELVQSGAGEVYVFLAGADRKKALAQVSSIQKKIAGLDGPGCSAGIALYPLAGYRKSAMAVNASKALRHASFFGENAKAVFDAVSLNISGDVYYNDGDLARSVREYRRGLRLDPKSVNLLNSLGVVLVQMNRFRSAIPLFEKAAAIDGKDFMAPFNLGFAYYEQGRPEAAVAAFEKALAIDGKHADLLFWLGRLYCQLARYGEALVLLKRAMAAQEATAPLLFALAEAYQGEGRNAEALVEVERAARLNPRDAGILSLLGELYCAEGQGGEVAMSLCQQAVELEDGAWQPWYRLGWVQSQLGDVAGARESLRQCLRLDRKNVAALYLLGSICKDAGQERQAGKIFTRVLRHQPDHGKAASALAELADV
ncbi:MAG: tetratricopeptide repeat protein [Desulfobulbaceae bacterium]|nr:tetratricopeptide repeat protein [Desulfobulbaceae bacterium]